MTAPIDLKSLRTEELIQWLELMEPGVERDLTLFHWKHKNWPDAGIFSTLHGGDCARNLLLALKGKLDWPQTAKIDGKTVTLEYEKNFNDFVKGLKRVLEQPTK